MSKKNLRHPGARSSLREQARFAWVALTLCAPLLVLPGAAQADTARDYRKAVKLALSELELGNHVEANAQFERAHRLNPSARTLRGLGIIVALSSSDPGTASTYGSTTGAALEGP